MADTIYLKLTGTLSAVGSLSGSLSGQSTLSGQLSIPSYIGTVYDGEYVVTPKAYSSQVLNTQYKLMQENVTVLEVPYYQSSNTYGDTVFIASEV